ncbi:MAG: hypothetical protein RR255_00280 [Bacilli bacterium]
MDKKEIKLYELSYFQNGYDVPYSLTKGGNILIKPILVKDYPVYEFSHTVLNIKKNDTDNIEIIQMSYLEFLINEILNGKEDYSIQLSTIFDLCLDEKKIKIGMDKGKKCLIICDEKDNIKMVIHKKEFDDIRKIILYQNDIKYDDREISSEIIKITNEYYSIKYKNTEIPSLEKRKAFVSSKTGISLKEINDMNYRFFDLVYDSSVNSELYFAQKIIQASPKYDIGKDVSYPLYTKERDKYEVAFIDESTYKGKVSTIN